MLSGKSLFWIVFLFFFVSACAFLPSASKEIDMDNLTYELVWSDEFDYTGLPDPEKWGYDVGGAGWGNNERQFYTDGENAFVDGEKLVIELRPQDSLLIPATSARMVTRNKGDWLYGRIEVRAKLPAGVGTWPAIWMMPTDSVYGPWPRSGEIDIMEHVGFDHGNVHSSIHTAAFNHMHNTHKGSGGRNVSGADREFHVYAVEWLPHELRFFIDDALTYTYNPGNYTDDITDREWPFDQRFHLILNIAWGGNWGGQRGLDPDALPATMEVDYVRVYQARELGN
jgi:beta-glucanase (GH16 family)